MERRDFLRTSLSGVALYLTPNWSRSAFSFARSQPGAISAEEITARINQRLLEKNIDYPAVIHVFGNPDKEQELRKRIREIPDLVSLMEPYRVRGLIRLKESRLPPHIKNLLLDRELEKVMHEVGTCLDHFLGVFDVLRHWGWGQDVAYIGLFHAIYGTEFNPVTVLDVNRTSDNQLVRRVIGKRCERWTRIYGTLRSADFISELSQRSVPSTYRVSSKLVLPRKEFGIMADVLVANSYEPFLSTGDRNVLQRLRQFKPLERYLSLGAREALSLA